jgi:Cu/Ag efflux protein CusF
MKKYLLFALLAAAVMAAPCVTSAADKPGKRTEKKTHGEADKKGSASKPVPFRGDVKSVDKKQMTLTIAGKEHDRQFQITSETRIFKAGKPAIIDDLKDGEEVTGSYWDAEGKLNLINVFIGGKNADAEKKEGKGKKEGKK